MSHSPARHADLFTSAFVQSKDGTRIHYQTCGTGPALIIIPGALSLAEDFIKLCQALAETFTVHIIERRGRGQSGPMGEDYSITKECEDIAAVQTKTGAALLFGHSYGGLIALEAARNNPLVQKLAVYEPGVSINHSIKLDWIPAYQAHLAEGQPRHAFVVFIRDTGPAFLKFLPNWWLRFAISKVIRGEEWRQMVGLMPQNAIEHTALGRLENTYPNYREVSADALLMAGGKSPAFREETLRTLAGVLPQSRIELLPNLDHFGPTRGAPEQVAESLKKHFLQ